MSLKMNNSKPSHFIVHIHLMCFTFTNTRTEFNCFGVLLCFFVPRSTHAYSQTHFMLYNISCKTARSELKFGTVNKAVPRISWMIK